MITIYEIKSNGYIGSSRQIDPKEGVGPGWTYTAPPSDGPHEWISGKWEPRKSEPERSFGGLDVIGLASDARQERNNLLSQSDWTQVSDAPVDQAAWAAYRQALRDITLQPGFPINIDWPVKP